MNHPHGANIYVASTPRHYTSYSLASATASSDGGSSDGGSVSSSGGSCGGAGVAGVAGEAMALPPLYTMEMRARCGGGVREM